MEGGRVSRCCLTCICNGIFFLISLLCGPHLRVMRMYVLCKSVLPSAYKLKVTASCSLAWSSGVLCSSASNWCWAQVPKTEAVGKNLFQNAVIFFLLRPLYCWDIF